MAEILIYPAGSGKAVSFAAARLQRNGFALTDHPTPEVTHLLLDVPTRKIPEGLLEMLPENITVVGGNLSHPQLEGYQKLDLLKNLRYLARNASITADCALRVAASRMDFVFYGSSVLVIGWGRIGKCLAALLKCVGCTVTVAARKESDRAMLEALGYKAADPANLHNLARFHLIYNTVPAPVLDENGLSQCPDALKIDLASQPGLGGSDVIRALGLPGVYAPASSGRLIAETLIKEVKP